MTNKDLALLHIAVLTRMGGMLEGVIDQVTTSNNVSISTRQKTLMEMNTQLGALNFARDELTRIYGKPPVIIDGGHTVTKGEPTGANMNDLPDVTG